MMAVIYNKKGLPDKFVYGKIATNPGPAPSPKRSSRPAERGQNLMKFLPHPVLYLAVPEANRVGSLSLIQR
jgi:hypothetical protein